MRGRYVSEDLCTDLLADRLDTQIFTPILHWIEGKSGPAPKPVPYPYGSRGPKELDSFIGKYGFKRTVPD